MKDNFSSIIFQMFPLAITLPSPSFMILMADLHSTIKRGIGREEKRERAKGEEVKKRGGKKISSQSSSCPVRLQS